MLLPPQRNQIKESMKLSKNPWSTFLTSERYINLALLAFRLLVGILMLTHGVTKIMDYGQLKATFPDPIGWGAGLSLVMIILAEAGCSLLVIAGLLTRFAVLPLIFGMAIVAFVVQSPASLSAIELPLLYMGLYVVLFIAGPGKYSLDYLLVKFLTREKFGKPVV